MLNARVLQSMRLELQLGNPSNGWIRKQHRLLQTKHKASRDAQIDFVPHVTVPLFRLVKCVLSKYMIWQQLTPL